MTTLSYSRLVDLSHLITTDIPRWPGDPPAQFDTVASVAENGYYLRRFTMSEHGATHMNAPRSFDPAGAGIDSYRPASLIVPAVVIDASATASANADFALQVDDVHRWESQHGRIPSGSLVLLHTGWQMRWQEPEAFLGRDAQGGLHFPGFGDLTTRFLLERREAAGIGIDTHGVDGGQSTTFASNRVVLEHHGIVLENLANLDQLPPLGTTLVIGILRLLHGAGSPASVLALLP